MSKINEISIESADFKISMLIDGCLITFNFKSEKLKKKSVNLLKILETTVFYFLDFESTCDTSIYFNKKELGVF